jgi:hypothetical protein
MGLRLGNLNAPSENGIAIGAAAPREAAGMPLRLTATTVPEETRDDDRRRSLLVAVGLHALLFASFMIDLSPSKPRVPASSAMQVSYIQIPGDPPAGEAQGDAPPPPAKVAPEVRDAAENVTETKPESKPDEVPSTTPDPDPTEAAPTPEAPAPVAQAGPETTRPVPSDQVGTGSMALGAKTHGDAKGLNPGLMASVGQAVAGQVRACWTPPTTGVPANTASSVIVRYARDGTIDGEPSVIRLVDEQEVPVLIPDQWEAAAVEALRNCSPIKLPPSIYPYWREVEVQIFSVPGV